MPKQLIKSIFFYSFHNSCTKYGLPDPLSILSDPPPTKAPLKRLVRSKVCDFWEKKLRQDAGNLESLRFFKTDFHSLSNPHPIWTAAGQNPYEVKKAIVQAKMLSGRYRSCWHSRHWVANSSGACSLPSCR